MLASILVWADLVVLVWWVKVRAVSDESAVASLVEDAYG